MDDAAAYLIGDGGGIFAVDLANGSLRWNTTPTWPYTEGYNATAPPVITPHALFLVDGLMNIDDLNPLTGSFRWSGPVGTTTYCSPAVVGDALVYGDDDGTLFYVAPTHAATWPVTGVVRALNGSPIAGASLEVPSVYAASTGADGSFVLELANGSYPLSIQAVGFLSRTVPLNVSGPTGNLTYVLRPVTLYPVYGRVVDAGNDRGLSGVPVRLVGETYYVVSTAVSGPNGAFVIFGPNGTDYLTAAPPSGYEEVASSVVVAGGPTYGAEIALPPAGLIVSSPGWPGALTFGWGLGTIPLAALGLGAAGLGGWAISYQRARRGLGGQVLSPFGRRIVRRLLLVPGQALILLAILFLFGAMLPSAVQFPQSPCHVAGQTSQNACEFWTGSSTCPWTQFGCVAASFLSGWWHLVVNIFTGQWGTDTFGKNTELVTQMISWWLPPSVELAIFALGISAALAYPIGLLAGWRPESPFDTTVRLGSLLGLLIPSFLVILMVFLAIYQGFLNAFGDTPYGTLPDLQWYGAHGGGPPSWIGLGGNTEPTGFPLVDAGLHEDWPFFLVVLVKTLLQAFLIALVYVAIFLRYARHAVAERARSLPVVAARARGVPERTLLWRHAGREVLPVYVLIFGITLPIYLGTQALAEAFFNDTGILKIVISEMTTLQTTGFGISVGAQPAGNLYQVVIFLLLLLVLAGSIASDAIAHWLDPRLARER
jgi:peptide/nickel transport system permease protein